MHAPDEQPPPQMTSHVRDHLANERTLLSWVRLGLSAAGFGFVVARFGLFLRESSGQSASAHPGRLTEWIGVVLILLGPTLVIIAALRFFQTEREIDANIYRKRYGLIWSVVATSVVFGLALAGYLIVTGR
ncbi:MAG: DUF202 domain-containing protein [Thermomicrobia bacterium]|nr:DUF202 domain-containing protein [Thermomicrobia bacterium]MCA1724537.1 DUF202 domain-containing protein [Thermomicrobia bacterium]